MNDDTQQRIAAWLVGDLPLDDVAAFENELATDPNLARSADEMAETLFDLGGPEISAPEGFAEQVFARVADGSADRSSSTSERPANVHSIDAARRRRPWIGAAAAVLLIGVSLVGVNALRNSPTSEDGVASVSADDLTDTSEEVDQTSLAPEMGSDAAGVEAAQVVQGDDEAYSANGQSDSDSASEPNVLAVGRVGPVQLDLSGAGPQNLDQIQSAVLSSGIESPLQAYDTRDAAELQRLFRDEILASSGDSALCVTNVLEAATINSIPTAFARALDESGNEVAVFGVVPPEGDVFGSAEIWVLNPSDCAVIAVRS